MKSIKPTESELDILKVIWEKGSATVREVNEYFALEKNAGYTTTLKLMQIMHEKGLLSRKQHGKLHIYQAAIKKEQTQSMLLQQMIDNVFAGSASGLVMQALGNKKTSKKEIEAIREYLDSLRK